MTSTMSNEGAQHFYRKLGCRYAGGLLLNDEPLEILLAKTILKCAANGCCPCEGDAAVSFFL